MAAHIAPPCLASSSNHVPQNRVSQLHHHDACVDDADDDASLLMTAMHHRFHLHRVQPKLAAATCRLLAVSSNASGGLQSLLFASFSQPQGQ